MPQRNIRTGREQFKTPRGRRCSGAPRPNIDAMKKDRGLEMQKP
jgi:hypothetical protein